jgi:hypothetical protein
VPDPAPPVAATEPAPPPVAVDPATPAPANSAAARPLLSPTPLPPGFPNLADRLLEPDHAPTPYTAAEIRAACPKGRVSTWRMVTDKGTFFSVQRFVDVDARGARLQSLLTREDGIQSGSTEASSGTWEKLQSHASFPADSTRILAERIRVPAGEYDCWVYEVAEEKTLTTYWFPRALPGPPVRVVIREGEKQILSMELVEVRLGETGNP